MARIQWCQRQETFQICSVHAALLAIAIAKQPEKGSSEMRFVPLCAVLNLFHW